tara:strand:- start:127 stop:267 length:141 start_codon:yes stop_codon:yes gene_type:complete
MTSAEKITNAKKRIEELERLIKCWNKSEEESSEIVNCSFKLDDKIT